MGMATKETIELEIDGDLLKRARDAGVDLPAVLERARDAGVDVRIVLERVLRHRRPAPSAEEQARWNEENREAIEASNRYVEEHGLPLAQYRRYPWSKGRRHPKLDPRIGSRRSRLQIKRTTIPADRPARLYPALNPYRLASRT